MADPKLVEILKQGSEVWNQWRKQQPVEMRVDLREADLRGTNLHGVILTRARLYKTNLSDADLSDADLQGANLNFANLSYANLRNSLFFRAYLNNTNLSGANLCGATLNRAELYNTNLSHADLSGTELHYATLGNVAINEANLRQMKTRGTTFAHMDLSGAKGLAEIQHEGPSHIALYSVQLPYNDSALHFLRGAGVPDEWIDDYLARMPHPIHYYSCFISYSSKDAQFARHLHADLQDKGVRCWFAPEDMKIGDKIRSRIDEVIHLQDKLLLLLSEHSLTSNWVEIEVEAALEKEQRQGCEVLFPVMLDESVIQTNQAWAKQLRRSRHIGDFTCWKDHDSYQQAFEKLLRDLKAESNAGVKADGE